MNTISLPENDPRVELLFGGSRPWFDVDEKRFIKSATLYIAFGCPDWGETKGKRNGLCTFCALPNSVAAFRDTFYDGDDVPLEDHYTFFKSNLQKLMQSEKDLHTLMIFNAGSFLAMDDVLQKNILSTIVKYDTIKRVVIESRAPLISDEKILPLVSILEECGKKLSIRVGVETQDDHLRLKVLRKGHSRRALEKAVVTMKKYGVTSGGYALLKPAPTNDLRNVMKKPSATDTEVEQWSVQETKDTISWILDSDDAGGLGMDEVYYCSTNVGLQTPLEKSWRQGDFTPATLWMIYAVLLDVAKKYGGRVHLLPFTDEPPFLAVSSNHIARGIHEDLTDAKGCDRAFHKMLSNYRDSMNIRVLKPPKCTCRPSWITE